MNPDRGHFVEKVKMFFGRQRDSISGKVPIEADIGELRLEIMVFPF